MAQAQAQHELAKGIADAQSRKAQEEIQKKQEQGTLKRQIKDLELEIIKLG
jgi:hypothetical protein